MQFTHIKLTVSALVMILLVMSSCKKPAVYEGHPVLMYTFNGLDDDITLYGNYSDSPHILYSFGQQIPNRSNFETRFEDPNFRARYWASPDTLPKDTPVFEQQFSLGNGKIYSLYLTGDKSEVDHLLVENKLKYSNADSVTYMQVVNLSKDQPVSVSIKGNPGAALIAGLPYKGATEFLELVADHRITEYEFEFRDTATGELLLTYALSDVSVGSGFLFTNWTLIISGKRGVSDINALGASIYRYK